MISLLGYLLPFFFAAQFESIDFFLNMIFGAFGLFFFLFIAIFVGIFVYAFYMICRSMRSKSRSMIPTSVSINATPSHERRVVRESLPAACPECDAPLRYNEVKWVGPRRAECPYCGTVVELEETVVTESY
jgi:hypothetical protein